MSIKDIIPKLPLSQNDIQLTVRKYPQRGFFDQTIQEWQTPNRNKNGYIFESSEGQSSDYHISVVYQEQNQLQDYQQVRQNINLSVERSDASISARLYAKIQELKREKEVVLQKSQAIDRRLKDVQKLVGEVMMQDEKQISRIQQRTQHQVQKLHEFYGDKIKAIQRQWQNKFDKIQKIFQNDQKHNKLDNQELMEKIQRQFQGELRNLEIEKINIIQAQEEKRLEIIRNHNKEIAKIQTEHNTIINQAQIKHRQQLKQLQKLKDQNAKNFQDIISNKQEQCSRKIQQILRESKEKQVALKAQLNILSKERRKQIVQLELLKSRKMDINKQQQDQNYRVVIEQKNRKIRILEQKLKNSEKKFEEQLELKDKALFDLQIKYQFLGKQFEGKISQLKIQHIQQLNRKQTTMRRQHLSSKTQQNTEALKQVFSQKMKELSESYQFKIQNLNQQILNSKNQTLRIASKIKKQNDLQHARKEEVYRGQIDQLSKFYAEQSKNWQFNYEQAIKDYSGQLSKRKFIQSSNMTKVKRDKEEQLRKRLNEKIKEFAKVQAELLTIKNKQTWFKNEIQKYKKEAQLKETQNKRIVFKFQSQLNLLKQQIVTLSSQLKQKDHQMKLELQKNSDYEHKFSELKINHTKQQIQRQKYDISIQMRELKQKITFLRQQNQAQISYITKNFEKSIEEKEVKNKFQIKCLNQKIENLTQKLKDKEKEIQDERKIHQKNLSIFIDKKAPERAKSYDKTDKTIVISKQNSIIIEKMPQILEHTRKLQKDKQKLTEQLKVMKSTNREMRIIISTSLSRFEIEKQMNQQIGQLRSKLKYFQEVQRRSSQSNDRKNGYRSNSKQPIQNHQNSNCAKIASYQANLNSFKTQNHQLTKRTYFKPDRKEMHHSFETLDKPKQILTNQGEKYFAEQTKILNNSFLMKNFKKYQ